ncbi:DNA gyrase subunit A [Christensenella sp. MSJ-20]|uniref:DNA gyrase subunit A n=1 Tax=Christensenella sp. MSJ-20 TaxID=2841518 RepID=UPI001C7956A5|nr:DNA gyrase subunit A [Christensenella sp. MSJ-20]
MDENKQMNIGRVQSVDIEKEMKESFISYAMAVIINRALPDVRDGLKPVHRRILYSMSELGLWSDRPYRKCARIVGDVLGKYHPHGDSAVYDSLVRMAQDFSIRYTLVDGHGNFGSVDGDSAAAMRYTEARMSKVSSELLADIDKETVDFGPNFDETLTQPLVLPCRIPNLLVNGSGGIAVGMATNIPPHNLREVVDGAIALIDNPDLDSVGLMEYVKGPDFPTGGVIMGYSGIRSAYATGRGRIVVRAVAEIEQFTHNRFRILVTEIPYQVNKARLVEKIAELVHDKRLEGISDLRDESDRNGMRIVIELKRDVNPNVVLNNLYKHTQMQDTFGVIMLALVDGEPKILSLHQMLHYYIEHRKDVVIRRTRYELNRAQARAHILEGLLIALDHIDEVIRIIRSSRDDAESKARLMERFGLSEKQSQAILDMRLRRLTGLERDKIQAEYAELQKTIEYLTRVLGDMALVMGIIKDELMEVREKYGDDRRTKIEPIEGEVDIEDLIQEEDMVVTLTRFGYIKRIGADTYRIQNRGGKGISGLTTREEDFVETVFVANTHTPILFFTNTGRVFTLKCYQLPLAGRTAKGSAIVNLLRLGPGEKITTVLPLSDSGKYLVMATRKGIIKKTPVEDFRNIRQNGLVAIGIREDDELCGVFLTSGRDDIILGTREGMSIRFHEEDVRPMGRSAMGVRSIKLKPGDEVLDVNKLDRELVLTISENGYGKLTPASEYTRQNRGGMGIKTLNVTQKTGPVAGLKVVSGDEDLVMIDQDGTIIRINASQISVLSRLTQGVRLMRVSEGNRVVAIAVVEPDEEMPEGETAETVEE